MGDTAVTLITVLRGGIGPDEYIVAGAPAVVANLWDVSGRDIDRLTGSLLVEWQGVGWKSGLAEDCAAELELRAAERR